VIPLEPYVAALASLSPAVRAALLSGDWAAFEVA
jgi:hypothetical protein